MTPAEVETPVAEQSLFAGDTGALPLDTRQVLCKLLAGPYLEAESPHWPALLRDEGLLRSRLADVFLELVVDRDRRVAFARQADTGELDTPVLQRASALTFLDSVMVLHLRQLLVDADGLDQRAVVEEDELIEHLELFAAGAGGDSVSIRKRIGASIEKMKKNNILGSIRGGEGRYEIAPVLRLLFTADDVQALTERYRALGAGQAAPDAPEDDDHG